MSTVVDWLLGFRSLRPGDRGVQWGFEHALSPWVWVLIGLLAALAAWWSYRRMEGPRWARVSLGVARALLLVLLAVLAAGPKLVRPNEAVEKDWVVVLVDRSASMGIADAPGGDAGAGGSNPGAGAPRLTREAQARTALANGRAAIDAAGKDRVLLWLGFDGGAFDLRPDPSWSEPGPGRGALPVKLDEPIGARTDLGVALEQGLARVAARPLSGVVVLSDGRTAGEVPRGVLRRLTAEKVPIVAVPLGSPEPIEDVSVGSVQGPGVAFVGDVVPVEAVVGRTGRADGVRVQLIDAATGAVLDERPVEWPSEQGVGGGGDAVPAPARVTLTSTPEGAGALRWVVRVVRRGASEGAVAAPDLIPGNDEAALGVNLVDRPLRVLYVDGYPRWEYRYLQAILTRERSVASTAMLLSAGRRFLQEGNTPMAGLPSTPAEWNALDVVVMGDVRPEVFSGEQLRQLRERVASGGAGLLWIAGESAVPGQWRGTPLGDLLPIASGSTLGRAGGLMGGGEAQRTFEGEVTLSPTPLAERLGVLRLLRTPENGSWWPRQVSEPETGWSRLRWVQRIDASALKPAAEVLAVATPVDAAGGTDRGPDGGGEGAPGAAVVTMRFGAGRVVYVATDEIWRWRYGRGEDLPERFWLQLIRLLGRDSVARAGKAALLTASPSRAEVGQPVRLQLEVIDQVLADTAPATFTVRVSPKVGEASAANAPTAQADGRDTVDVTLRLVQPTGGGTAGGASGAARPTYTGTFIAARKGDFVAAPLDAPLLAAGEVSAEIEVRSPDDELRRPESDHPLLARLAAETGGAALNPSDLSKLPELLPRREVHVALTPDEHTLWDRPLSLLLLALLFTLEWVGRRLLRLA